MKIAVVGTGYVGLVTGTCFAETGNSVVCIDINEEKVRQMQNGIIPIFEPGLEDLFQRNIEEGRLTFTTSLADGVYGAEIIFLALPTPSGEDGSADLSYIMGVARELGKILHQYVVVVDKSTVPVGTSEKVRAAIEEHCKVEFDVVSNPEFLREGVAVDDFMKPERVVIGTSSEKAKKVMEKLYAPFVRQGNPIFVMDEKSAELTKYAANAFLAMKISFMNEVANLAEKLGADIDKVRRGIGSDSRIGNKFLYAGTGYGGSCFPKDVKALSKTSLEYQFDFKILNAVMKVNAEQKTVLLPKIKRYFGDLSGKTFALWGLAFKPNTDDIREAPALEMIEELLKAGAKVKAFDPEAMNNVKKVVQNRVEFTSKAYDALAGADALIIMTEWNEFRLPDFGKISSLLKNKVIFDGRNLYDLSHMKELGYHYESIGRPAVTA
ncbi:MAG: UDP-glucose/GDP-mannose dehydrogenase family protein [Cytophagaceae bacterium]|nr:UDP-glucose/GDP-mannose dehydrogenase family protein [Cytophagaceae bacterium]